MGGLFRGVRAPASLKLGFPQVCVIHGVNELFRGVRAPASLKLAGHGDIHGAPLPGSSGAYAPRPH